MAYYGAGFAKANRFEVNFVPPVGDHRNVGGASEVSLLCDSITIPGKQINTFEYPFHLVKQDVKVPNGYIYEDVTCSILLTTDYNLKNLFDAWQNTIIGDDFLLSYAATYERDVTINQLDEKFGLPVYSCKLLGAYPVSVNSISLGNSLRDTISRFDVTFTYHTIEITK